MQERYLGDSHDFIKYALAPPEMADRLTSVLRAFSKRNPKVELII
jgi:hypothetical protein